MFKARLVLGLLTALSLTVVSIDRTTAQSAEPPSLQGEGLFFADPVPPAAFDSITCNPLGVSQGSVRVEGIAFGPYSGTFVETVSASFSGGGPGVAFPLSAFHADFDIDSPVGRVTGTKALVSGVGLCVRDVPGTVRSQWAIFALFEYEATIETPFGSFRDIGDGNVSISLLCFASGVCGISHIENFTLSRGLLALDTTGKATGGGQLGDLLSGDFVSFGFEVKQPELGKLQGRCVVNDSEASTKIKCLDVTSYSQIGNTATWTGRAEVNGAIEDYRITVQDNGEPNQGIDTFSIVTESYEAASNVEHGNVQLHKQKSVP